MKTQIIMKRELFGKQIAQQSKTEFFSGTDLAVAGNKWRKENGLKEFKPQEWFRTKGTKEFVNEIEIKYGVAKKTTKGRNSHTWLHPLLFIDMALSISPKLKIEVYSWLFVHLIRTRNESGNSYKEMCGALWVRATNKKTFSQDISKVAYLIQNECGVNNWQEATEKQLKLRDKMHGNIALLANVLNNNKEAVRLGIQNAKL